jgi:hypothetical protein
MVGVHSLLGRFLGLFRDTPHYPLTQPKRSFLAPRMAVSLVTSAFMFLAWMGTPGLGWPWLFSAWPAALVVGQEH